MKYGRWEREIGNFEVKYDKYERGSGYMREKEFLARISSLHELMIVRESVQRRRSQFVI